MFKPTYLYVKVHNKTGMRYFGKTISNPYTYKGSGTLWIRHINKYGNDVTTHVIGFFDNKDQLTEAAVTFSRENNIVDDESWANLMIEAGTGPAEYSAQTIEQKREYMREHNPMYLPDVRKKHKSIMRDPDRCAEISYRMTGSRNPNFGNTGPNGYKHTDQIKQEISLRMTENNPMSSSEVRDRHRISMQDPERRLAASKRMIENNPAKDEAVRNKISSAVRAQPKKTCPHCKKDIDCRNFARYHGAKCKNYGM